MPTNLTDLEFTLLCRAADADGPKSLSELLPETPDGMGLAAYRLKTFGFLGQPDRSPKYYITGSGREYLAQPAANLR